MKEDKAYIGDEKNIKDYLHLYLGCEVKTYSGTGNLVRFDFLSGSWYVQLKRGGGTVGNINDKNIPVPIVNKPDPLKYKSGTSNTYYQSENRKYKDFLQSVKTFPDGYPPKSILKPILRPLSDMTEEELQECGNMVYDFSDDPYLNNHEWKDFEIGLAPEQFHWLISKHFDLFGLIESGLAIDKTTLNKQS